MIARNLAEKGGKQESKKHEKESKNVANKGRQQETLQEKEAEWKERNIDKTYAKEAFTRQQEAR